jgi:hypothetical protein
VDDRYASRWIISLWSYDEKTFKRNKKCIIN